MNRNDSEKTNTSKTKNRISDKQGQAVKNKKNTNSTKNASVTKSKKVAAKPKVKSVPKKMKVDERKDNKKVKKITTKKGGQIIKLKDSKNIKNIKHNIAVQNDIVKPKNKKRKKRVIAFVFSSIIIGLLICGIYLLFTLDRFNLKEVALEDGSKNAKYSAEEISAAYNLGVDSNIFRQYFKVLFEKESKLPYLESVDFRVKLPNKIIINSTNRIPKYYAFDKENNRFFKLNEYGYILEELPTIDSKTKEELLLYGIVFDSEVVLGSQINEIYLSKFNIYNNIESEFTKSGINGTITKVNFENSLTSITLNDKLNVIFPNDTNLKYNINFLKSILSNIGEESVGVIDMTKSNPTFSSF